MSDYPEKSADDLMQSFDDDAQMQREKDLADFCDQLASLPENYEPTLAEGITADIDLHPLRWMFLGLDLLSSAKTCFFGAILPYPVFQMGTEVFLKGLWLCQFDECRLLKDDYYISPPVRQRLAHGLKDLGHDLLAVIAALRQTPCYRDDAYT